MDLKEMITKVEEKLKNDSGFREALMKNPLKELEGLLGIDIPEDTLKQVLEAVKDKIDLKEVSGFVKEAEEKLGGVGKVIEGIFHKK
ncbi:hypothetical protein NXH76_03580 [Blautia schinkii]|nr:hypothetical protein [Blautia schinkii]